MAHTESSKGGQKTKAEWKIYIYISRSIALAFYFPISVRFFASYWSLLLFFALLVSVLEQVGLQVEEVEQELQQYGTEGRHTINCSFNK